MEKNAKWIVLFGVFCVSFASILAKIGTAPSAVLSLYRLSFASIFLLPVVLKKHRKELKELTGKQLLLGIVSGIMFSFHLWSYTEAVRNTTVASAAVLLHTEIFFVCVMSWLLFREMISKIGLGGMILAFLGCILLTISDRSIGTNALLGDALALVSAAMICAHTMIGSGVRKALSNSVYTFLVYTSAAVTLLLINLGSGRKLTGYGPINVLCGFLLCVICTFLGHSIFNWGLKYLRASVISNLKLAELIFSTFLAWMFFGQIPDLLKVIGAVLAAAGIMLFLREDVG